MLRKSLALRSRRTWHPTWAWPNWACSLAVGLAQWLGHRIGEPLMSPRAVTVGPMGPNLGPGPFWAQYFFLIFWVARGTSLTKLGHFTKFWSGSNFKLFWERFSLITHLPPDHWGANPCKKHAGDLREPAETLQKSTPWHQKSKPSRKHLSNLVLFWANFWCCNTTTLREQP